MSEDFATVRTRLHMAALGALAGLVLWYLAHELPDVVENQRLQLWVSCVLGGFFGLLLILLGQLRGAAAVAVAAGLSLVTASLLVWSSYRAAEFDDLFEHGFSPLAAAILIFVGAPFGVASAKGRILDYALLFDTAWGIVVRYVAALVFVGLFWGAVFLSDMLLGIVGIDIIEELIDIEPVPFFLSGLVLGLALAVANELRSYVSPYLILRLLRLLLPMALFVVAVFVVMLPVAGLSSLFGQFSTAATLMTVAFCSATLITSAVDSDPTEEVTSWAMRQMTRALAALLPIVGVLAVYAMWLRIAEYGWTPQRLAGFVGAGVVLAYGVLYALSLVDLNGWMARIRQANAVLALGVLGLAALWMTPVLDPYRLSVKSQLARFEAGQADFDQLPIWEMANEWGVAGAAGITELRATSTDAELIARLEAAGTMSKWEFAREEKQKTNLDLAETLLTSATLWPKAMGVSAEQIAKLPHYWLQQRVNNCTTETCVIVLGPFGAGGKDAIMLVERLNDGDLVHRVDLQTMRATRSPDQIKLTEPEYDALWAGAFDIAPSSRQSIWIGGREINTIN